MLPAHAPGLAEEGAMLGLRFAKLSWFERFLHLFTSVRPGEGRSIFLLLLQVYLLLLAYYLIRPVREALILAEGTPEVRSYAVGAVAIVLIFLIPLYKLLFDRLDGNGSKSSVLRWVMLFFVVNLGLFYAMGALAVPVSVPFFIWVGIFSVMVLAQFWAFAADLFNIKTGQRLFAVIAVGSAMGAWTGSRLSGYLFPLIGPYNLMLVSAALLGVTVWLSAVVESSVPEGSRASDSVAEGPSPAGGLRELLGGFDVVVRNRYLLLIAAFVALLNLVNSTGGYILASFVRTHVAGLVAAGSALSERDLIGQIYGDYFAWITLIQLALQLFVVSRVFRYFGVRGALLVLPAVMVINYGLIAMVPVFSIVRIMMIIENSTNYSIQSTTNHSLYLPVTRQEKYVGKTTIDTFFWRFGDLLHAFMIFLVTQVLGVGLTPIVAANFVLALAMLALALAIGRHHRREVRQNLVNLPPRVEAPLRDVYVPAGQVLVFSVPDKAFMDPDPGDTLSYRAQLADGRALPAWISFDRYKQTFTLCPPEGGEGCVEVELVATDFEGLQVSSRFRIEHGADPVPRFISGPEDLARAG
jgi:AAA family ATP:ADP antiporter